MFSLIISDSGVCTSSEEETAPPDDGPFAFRRKPGCYYEMVSFLLFLFLVFEGNVSGTLAHYQAKDKQYRHIHTHKEIYFHIKRSRAAKLRYCF